MPSRIAFLNDLALLQPSQPPWHCAVSESWPLAAPAPTREGGARGAALEKRSAGGQTPVVGPKLFQAALDGPKP